MSDRFSEASTTITTPLGGHAYARTLALRAEGAGLTVTHRHDDRLIIRTHLITLTGDRGSLGWFIRAWNLYFDARRRGESAAALRARRWDNRRTIDRLVAEGTRR